VTLSYRSTEGEGRSDFLTPQTFEVRVKNCAELKGSEKAGFACEADGEGFRFIDVPRLAGSGSPDRKQLPLFHHQEDCLSAGYSKNAFWRCLPDETGKTVALELEGALKSPPSDLISRRRGEFHSLSECQQAQSAMRIGLVCLPESKGYRAVSLLQHDFPGELHSNLDTCNRSLGEFNHGVSDGLNDLASQAPPEIFLEKAAQIPGVNALMKKPNTEGGSLGKHSSDVLRNWDESLKSDQAPWAQGLVNLASDLNISPERFNALLRTVILFHDLGKPLDHQKQHYGTVTLAHQVLKEMGFAPRQIELGLSLIDQDLIGEFLKSGGKTGDARALRYKVESLAHLLGVSSKDWMKLMIGMYTADASFYPSLRNSVFEKTTNGYLKVREPALWEVLEKLN
jgi:hypothetical protein